MTVIILLFIILLALSALFSGAETAYFNLKTHRNDIPSIIQKLLIFQSFLLSVKFSRLTF